MNNINIEHITINVTIQPQEPVQEATRLQEPFKRGHRTPEEIQGRLELAESRQLVLQKLAERLQRRLLIAEKLRATFGNETANSVVAGVL
jgi:hypothetical protein